MYTLEVYIYVYKMHTHVDLHVLVFIFFYKVEVSHLTSLFRKIPPENGYNSGAQILIL